MNMITDRYASAVNSHSLTVDPRTTMSDTDVLAAMGWASRQVPMAVALERLFAGDSTAANVIAAILAQQAFEYSFRIETKISRLQCADMAKACLAWHRNGRCRPCGGHGKTLIPGTARLSDHDCRVCGGTGLMPFEANFRQEWQELARWLVSEMARESGKAEPAAMRKLAPRLEL